jgi:L-ribulokinase
MDGSLTGAFTGLTLHHTPAHLYRALLEASAFGVRWIVELLREHGVPVNRFVATGGLPHHNPLVVEVYADVLGEPVTVHPCKHGPALGAAILGALAAGAFPSSTAAIRAMATAKAAPVIKPRANHRRAYDGLYARYRELAAHFSHPTS